MSIKSFNYKANFDARILILGSMPGKVSLEEQQYYAHPRNIFWDIMGILFGFERATTSYSDRIQILLNNKVALWDVLGECRREGSLDSKIESNSVVLNDFDYFFDNFNCIEYIVFNGKTAETLFAKKYLKLRQDQYLNIQCFSMPSTSPANASISRTDKIRAWSRIRDIYQ